FSRRRLALAGPRSADFASAMFSALAWRRSPKLEFRILNIMTDQSVLQEIFSSAPREEERGQDQWR
ncbi:MAG: hypothetical protein WBW37_14075, partial [Methyloceanibacter sp.]